MENNNDKTLNNIFLLLTKINNNYDIMFNLIK